MQRRFFSVLLVLALCLAVFPPPSHAADPVNGNAGDANKPRERDDSYTFDTPSEGIGAGRAGKDAYSWGERALLCKDAATLYLLLSENALLPGQDGQTAGQSSGIKPTGFLTQSDAFTLPEADPDAELRDVERVQISQDDELNYLAGSASDGANFAQSSFYTVDASVGDKSIKYADLKKGDLVRTSTFNGLYVTKIAKTNNPQYEADLAAVKSNMVASFRAFDLDHPEIFWLTGSVKQRFITVTSKGKQETYVFLTLVDDSGFSMRIPDYAADGALEQAIVQRDAAIDAILAQIPANASPRQAVTAINKWLTLNNEYNRSADLSAIGYLPHRSLKALVGAEGVNGPVCDGYSKAFKTLCDRLGIPAVLDTGNALINGHSEYHMWLRVNVDGSWYGVDCAWNDPVAPGKTGKVSGFENEKYLLVGADTVIDGVKFSVSHPSSASAGGADGVLFAELFLSGASVEDYAELPFSDVKLSDWFYDYVKAAYGRNIVGGMSAATYEPAGRLTHAQIMVMVANLHSRQKGDGFAAAPVAGEHWGAPFLNYCKEESIIDGRFDTLLDTPVTREEMCYYFANALTASSYKDKKEASFSDIADSAYAEDIEKLAKADIVSGYPDGTFNPSAPVTRAEAAVFVKNILDLIE